MLVDGATTIIFFRESATTILENKIYLILKLFNATWCRIKVYVGLFE